MDIPAGRAIEPREFEELSSRWAAEGGGRFASLCNALLCSALEAAAALPRISGRVFARDGGIDGEAEVGPLTLDGPGPLARAGRNVYQYKCRDVLGADRKKVLSSLGSKLKGEWQRLAGGEKGPPDHYFLLVNLNLIESESKDLLDRILDGAADDARGRVTLLHAGSIAALLSARPALLAGFFWSDTWVDFDELCRKHERGSMVNPLPGFVGRDRERREFQDFLEDPAARVLRVVGPPQSGKTRLVLEALRGSGHRVVSAVDAAVPLGGLLKLDQQTGIVVILDAPPSDRVEAWIREALERKSLKLVVTADELTGGGSRRVRVLRVGPLGLTEADRLLRDSHPGLDFNYRAWVLREFGDRPGLLLTAADLAPEVRDGRQESVQSLVDGLIGRIRSRTGDSGVHATRILSLLTEVEEQDLEVLSSLAGGPSVTEILELAQSLEEAGHLRRIPGGWRVVPGILANSLAKEAFRSDPRLPVHLLAAMNDRQGARLLARVAQAGVEAFWDAVFGDEGPLGGLPTLRGSLALLGHAARGAPTAALGWLREHLVTSSHEERAALEGETRRAVVSALDTLLFHGDTSQGAMEVLGLLGAAENETWGNSASELFVETLEPRHPQVPLSLEGRRQVADRLRARSEEPELGRLLVGAAARVTGYPMPPRYLRESTGLAPLAPPCRVTPAEELEHLLWLLDLLVVAARGEDAPGRSAALQALPDSVLGVYRRGFSPGDLEPVVAQLEEWGRATLPGLDLHRLAQVFRELGLPERARALEQASFATRLQALVGDWGLHDPGEERGRLEADLAGLACEAVASDGLSPALLDWLLSAAAPSGPRFLQALGRADGQARCLGEVQSAALRARFGWNGMGAYLMGLAEHSMERVREAVRGGLASGAWPEVGAIHVVSLLGPSSGLLALLPPLRDAEARAHGAEVFTRDSWVRDLGDPDFHRLLQTLSGPDLESAPAVVKLAGARARHSGPLDEPSSELAARCLELGRPKDSRVSDWHYDSLLAELARQQPERAFRVLEELLLDAPRCRSWHPLDPHLDRGKSRSAWSVLLELDPERALGVALDAAVADPAEAGVFIPWHLQGRVPLDRSGAFLFDFASRGPEHARVVAGLLGPEQPGFWELVDRLIQAAPQSESLEGALSWVLVGRKEPVLDGEDHRKEVARDVETVLKARSFSPAAETWLRRFVRRLRQPRPVPVLWDSPMDGEEFRAALADRSSPHRRWAIARVLREAPFKDLRRLLTVEDMLEVLPEADLPAYRRKALEGALPLWTADGRNPDTASA